MKNLILLSAILTTSLVSRTITVEASTSTIITENYTVVMNPTHPGSDLPISVYSSPDGACKMMGYDKSIEDSYLHESFMITPSENIFTLVVDKDGYVSSSEDSNAIKQIICLNPTGTMINELSIVLDENEVKYPGSQIALSRKSNVDGVCNLLGYDKGVRWSIRTNRSATNTQSLQINSCGAVEKSEVTNAIVKIVCLSRRW